MSLVERLESVRDQLASACTSAGREPSELTLVAVSKRHAPSAIREALGAGQLDFGENYAQELRDKRAALGDGPRWHFIGRLQRNKAKYVADAHLVHALETVRVAEALASRAASGVDALVMVDIGREPNKGGVDPEHVVDRVAELSAVEGIRIRGLMCLPPYREDPDDVGPFFEEMGHLLARCQAAGHPLTELSMGMSHDFHVAIRHGATIVRIGTAIFGPRPA